jgi:DNA polymerase-3 subunit gamma/tau
MEKFIVSARKYRPQTFDTVVGQSHITTTLKNAIKHQQLAHAFLFCGPRGVGKTTCARILAKTINCENPTKEGEACNKCTSCLSFNEGTSMNYFELDGASNNSVDNIRDLVDQIRFVPQTGKYKVYVIDEVHMLTQQAFNAFLKTLEEPPSYAIFILATTEKHKILPTILSRCQIFDFKRITLNDTVEHLQEICKKEKIEAEKAALHLIAQKSEGCLRDALSILDKIVSFTNGNVNYANTLEHLNILDADYYFQLLNSMKEQDLSGAMLLYDNINRKGFEGDMVLNGFAEFIRNLLVCKDEKAAVLLDVIDSFREKYITTAKNVSAALLISALNILNEAEINYKTARNKRLHVELCIIKLCYLQNAITIASEGNSISKKKVIDTAKSIAFRQIVPFPVKESDPKAKPSLPVPGNANINAKKSAEVYKKTNEATLVIEEPGKKFFREEKTTETSRIETGDNTPGTPKLTALDKIRKQYKNNGHQLNGNKNHPLQIEEVQSAWNEYVQKLKEAKNPAAQSFALATLRIKDENSIEVVTANNIEKQFIEQDRNSLFGFLQERLKNSLLQIVAIVEENPKERPEIEVTLSAKEQFLKMAEQYPLVKELKDRLKMELDY